MISQLQIPTFMREKIEFLAALARDMRDSIGSLTHLEFEEEGPEEINDLDVAEMIGSMEALSRDETLYDTFYWLPHNAYAALLQANLDTYYRRNQCVADADNQFGETLYEDPLNNSNMSLGIGAGVKGITAKIRQAFKLNRKDPRWVLVLQAKAIKRRKGTPPFPDNSANIVQLDTKARMLLVGDWASGVPNARKIAETMWNDYIQPELGRDLHVIHLGDSYYAGLASDYQNRFVPYWPVPLGYENHVSSWCLAGNHDMYSGGYGYFELLQNDVRFKAQNKSSYFLLENDHWQVFGLDTAFDPRDFRGEIGELYGEQAAWVARKRDSAPGKKAVVLTHHQPFCAYSPIRENLDRRLRPIRQADQIDAWFWGHEHLCAVYDSYDNVRYPVLLGHGGFPQKPKKHLAGAPPLNYEWLATDSSGDVLFGFAVLDFDSSQIDVRLIDQFGTHQKQFVIS